MLRRWKREEEKRLRELAEQGASTKSLAEAFCRSPDAIRMKMKRLGLCVVVQKKSAQRTTTNDLVPGGLLTHEETLRVLTGAIAKAQKPGLDKLEIMRLKVLIDAAKTYDSVLEKFERWVELEARLLAMGEKITELEKTQTTNAG